MRVFLDPHRLDAEDKRRQYGRITALYARGDRGQALCCCLHDAGSGHPRHFGPKSLDAAPIDYSDISPLGDEFFKRATAALPDTKEQLTIRIDADVLKWLKATGRGYILG